MGRAHEVDVEQPRSSGRGTSGPPSAHMDESIPLLNPTGSGNNPGSPVARKAGNQRTIIWVVSITVFSALLLAGLRGYTHGWFSSKPSPKPWTTPRAFARSNRTGQAINLTKAKIDQLRQIERQAKDAIKKVEAIPKSSGNMSTNTQKEIGAILNQAERIKHQATSMKKDQQHAKHVLEAAVAVATEISENATDIELMDNSTESLLVHKAEHMVDAINTAASKAHDATKKTSHTDSHKLEPVVAPKKPSMEPAPKSSASSSEAPTVGSTAAHAPHSTVNTTLPAIHQTLTGHMQVPTKVLRGVSVEHRAVRAKFDQVFSAAASAAIRHVLEIDVRAANIQVKTITGGRRSRRVQTVYYEYPEAPAVVVYMVTWPNKLAAAAGRDARDDLQAVIVGSVEEGLHKVDWTTQEKATATVKITKAPDAHVGVVAAQGPHDVLTPLPTRAAAAAATASTSKPTSRPTQGPHDVLTPLPTRAAAAAAATASTSKPTSRPTQKRLKHKTAPPRTMHAPPPPQGLTHPKAAHAISTPGTSLPSAGSVPGAKALKAKTALALGKQPQHTKHPTHKQLSFYEGLMLERQRREKQGLARIKSKKAAHKPLFDKSKFKHPFKDYETNPKTKSLPYGGYGKPATFESMERDYAKKENAQRVKNAPVRHPFKSMENKYYKSYKPRKPSSHTTPKQTARMAAREKAVQRAIGG